MKITDILWDYSDSGIVPDDLPTEVEVSDDLTADQIADYLTETYGWCVDSFAVPFRQNLKQDETDDEDEDDEDDDNIRKQVIDLFASSGWNLFGKFVDEVADAIADEVVAEYKEAGDGNLQKAISYVILDKFDKLF